MSHPLNKGSKPLQLTYNAPYTSPFASMKPSWAKRAMKSQAMRGTLRASATIGLVGVATVGAVSGLHKVFSGFQKGVMKNLHPNSIYPASSGKWGMSAGPANNAGLWGMRFDFRRK